MSSDRRNHVRVAPEDGYFLSCRPAGAEAPLPVSTRLLDVSPGGAGLQTLAPLREAARLDLSIILPEWMARFRARGVVRWSASRTFGSTSATVHYAGIRFEAVEETPGRATDWLGGAGGRPAGDPQRRHARVRPLVVDALLEPRTWARRLGLRKDVPVTVLDLGLGGARVDVGERLEPGLRSELRLRTARPDGALTADVEVRWCRRDTRLLAPRWTAGLAFRPMSPADAHLLRAIVRHYLG